MRVGFSSAIREFAEKVPKIFLFVRNDAVKNLIYDMQTPRVGFKYPSGVGNMPVYTEFLRASLLASTSHMPVMIQGHRPSSPSARYSYNPTPVHNVIEQAAITDTLYFGYQADYAAYQNYGTRNFPGRKFRDLAVQNWQKHVKNSASKARQVFGM